MNPLQPRDETYFIFNKGELKESKTKGISYSLPILGDVHTSGYQTLSSINNYLTNTLCLAKTNPTEFKENVNTLYGKAQSITAGNEASFLKKIEHINRLSTKIKDSYNPLTHVGSALSGIMPAQESVVKEIEAKAKRITEEMNRIEKLKLNGTDEDITNTTSEASDTASSTGEPEGFEMSDDDEDITAGYLDKISKANATPENFEIEELPTSHPKDFDNEINEVEKHLDAHIKEGEKLLGTLASSGPSPLTSTDGDTSEMELTSDLSAAELELEQLLSPTEKQDSGIDDKADLEKAILEDLEALLQEGKTLIPDLNTDIPQPSASTKTEKELSSDYKKEIKAAELELKDLLPPPTDSLPKTS